MLDADMSARYYQIIHQRYTLLHNGLKIFLGVMASGAVVSFPLWNWAPDTLWQVFVLLALIAGIALPIIDYPTRIRFAGSLISRWKTIKHSYQILWDQVNFLDRSKVLSEYKRLKDKEELAIELEAGLPRIKRLVQKCQGTVKKARNLSTPQEQSS